MTTDGAGDADAGQTSTLDPLLREVARAEPRSPPAGTLVGEVVDGKYRVEALLGSGGMGAVYRATHLGTGRAVALKVLVADLTADEAAVERFRREARAAGRLRHPNVVDVTDFGFAERGGERLAYLVMELLTGRTLRALLEAEGRLPVDVAVDLLDQVCAAVEEAHALGVLHRDLKPENIHLSPAPRGWHVKVLDFGIAKQLTGGEQASGPDAGGRAELATTDGPVSELATTQASSLAGTGDEAVTRRGAIVGTPRYMSPEQWRGEAVDARTDVYSLGVVAYEMLAGEPPLGGRDRWLARGHAPRTPLLVEKAPAVPRRIARVVEGALAEDPAARPPSARAFAAALHAGRETTGSLLRRSFALAFDHYPLLSVRCALASLPPVALTAAGALAATMDRGEHAHTVAATLARNAWAIGALAVASLLWTPVSGLLVPVVADLSASRPPSARPSAAVALRAVWLSIPSSLVSNGLIVVAAALVAAAMGMLGHVLGLDAYARWVAGLPSLLGVSLAGAPFAVLGHVVVVERLGGFAPLRRSARLVRPMWRAAFGVQVVLGALTLALPRLAVAALKGMGASLPGGDQGLVWVFSATVMPFVMVPPALLYLRAREAEGRPVRREVR